MSLNNQVDIEKLLLNPSNSRQKEQFIDFLQSNFDNETLFKVLTTLVKVFCKGDPSFTSEILERSFNENLIVNIKNYFSQVQSGKVHARYADAMLFLKYFDIMVINLKVENDSVVENCNNLLSLMENFSKTVTYFECQSSETANCETFINELMLLVKNKIKYIDESPVNRTYKDINIYPNPVNFYEEIELFPNKIEGDYSSAEEYLDIQFKLLLGDYTRTVQNGILQYKRELYGAPREPNAAIKVFKPVTVRSVHVCDNIRDGISYTIIFTEEDARRIRRDEKTSQKLFLNGQLVYFSSVTNFTTFIIATVTDNKVLITVRDNERKETVYRGINVSPVGGNSFLTVGEDYSLIEPTVFFEPYFQALRTLQFIEPSKFPMMNYIVLKRFDNRPPTYFDQNASLKIDYSKINLNEPQLKAFQSALSNEFTIIQGPPGTGKTHVVKAIINTLIDNNGNRESPILLVCSRNSSLDHVLVPLKKDGRNVLRLGGQSKDEDIKDCSISNLSSSKSGDKGLVKRMNIIKRQLEARAIGGRLKLPDIANYDEFRVKFLESCNADDVDAILKNEIHIVGATTTGAAKAHRMMALLQPEVVIIEEAAETLEPYVVASIPEGVKHVILVGDHKQLQPSPADHLSTEKYFFNISLFERLVKNGLKCNTLTIQHRMRPEISALITPIIYETLTDHSSVCSYPDVKGVQKNVFFLDHRIPENQVNAYKSHCNRHEGDFLLALADYLVKQGYESSEITILAGYSAQVNYMSDIARQYQTLKGTRISAIDNYQGEENLIILLSLVRSGSETIGFLKTFNRINVALSRAKHGLYIAGNMDTLSSKSQLWKDIKSQLLDQHSIGSSMPLICQVHGNVTYVKNQSDIGQLRLGGCDSACNSNMRCGHKCALSCHPPNTPHNCRQPCHRMVCEQHRSKCSAGCSMLCSFCNFMLAVRLKCGHQTQVACGKKNEEIMCDNCDTSERDISNNLSSMKVRGDRHSRRPRK